MLSFVCICDNASIIRRLCLSVIIRACVNECQCVFSFGCICDNAPIISRFCVSAVMRAYMHVFAFVFVLVYKCMYAGIRT